jgi:decaprenyl-phosphate phosphoribosyltransferase
VLRALIVTMRPAQWIKNILVAAAPLAAGDTSSASVRGTVVAFVTFCLASSAVYCLNDLVDVDADRRHPTKRRRPIAAGTLNRKPAAAAAVVLFVIAEALAVTARTHLLWLIILVYAGASTAYSLGLKHAAVIELAIVSSGFLLRAVAGGSAAGLPISQWFLIVASFGSLLLVAGKRLSELLTECAEPTPARRILSAYTPSFLRMVITVAAAVTCTAYCLWAFEIGGPDPSNWAAVSVAPFVIALLRYAMDADAGRVEEPEVVVRRDRVLQALGLIWLITFSIGAFSG